MQNRPLPHGCDTPSRNPLRTTGQNAGDIDGLAVPVVIDIDTYRDNYGRNDEDEESLEARLLADALASTPTPGDLPGTPLDRFLAHYERSTGAGDPS